MRVTGSQLQWDNVPTKRNDIQWLRALAAAEVMIWHSDLVTKGFSSFQIHESFYAPLGGIGVELFFILSGYIICMQAPTYKSGGAFLLSRFYRLLPLYWVFTTLVIVAYFLNPSWKLHGLNLDPATVIKSYLVLPQKTDPILGLGWTLEFEMIFYVIAALAMVAFVLNRHLKIAVALILSGLAFLGFLFGTGPSRRVWDYQLISPYLLAFGFGWLMRVMDEHGGLQRNAMAAGAFLIVCLASGYVANAVDFPLLGRMLLAGTVFAVVCKSRWLFEKNTSLNRLMGRIGDASYSLYLSHWFVLSIGGKILGRTGAPAGLDAPVRVVAVVLCTAAAYGIFLFIEKPIDRYLRGNARNRPTMAPDRVLPASG